MLNTEEQEIHERAVKFSKLLQTADAPLLRALRDAYETKLFRKFNRTGLFRYAVDILKHDEAVVRPYITVAKKCAEFPQVLAAIEARKFPVAKALRFVSVLKPTNVEKFIEYATTLNYEDLNHKVAAENPQKKKRSIHKPIGENKVRASYDFDRAFTTDLKTEAKRLNLDPAEVLKRAFYEMRERTDPVKKAERANARKERKPEQPPKELCVNKISIAKRRPIPAATAHAIKLRDGHRCTEVHGDGTRCENTKWLHIHHIKAVEDGGTNELSNLITLCYIHHELRHQLEFDLGLKSKRTRKANDVSRSPQ